VRGCWFAAANTIAQAILRKAEDLTQEEKPAVSLSPPSHLRAVRTRASSAGSGGLSEPADTPPIATAAYADLRRCCGVRAALHCQQAASTAGAEAAAAAAAAAEQPVLFSLSINIGGTPVPLDLRNGDVPQEVAAAFAKKHKVTDRQLLPD
jgi:hypothetical protein